MAGNRKSGGGNVAITTRKRRSGGGWVDLTIAKRRSGGAWVDLFAAPVVAISNQTLADAQDQPADAVATYELNSSGSNGFPGEWLTGGGTTSDYEVFATTFSDTITGPGTSISGTVGAWLNLGTTRAWSAFATANGNSQRVWVIDLTIRRVSDLVTMDTARITLDASTANP